MIAVEFLVYSRIEPRRPALVPESPQQITLKRVTADRIEDVEESVHVPANGDVTIVPVDATVTLRLVAQRVRV